MESLPSQTLYINNLNEKIDKKIIKKTLYMVFSQYGKIQEIVACKGVKLRGQAWIVFEDITAATSALRGKQGFNFYDKPLRIAFAKMKSDIIAKKDGTYQPREKRPREIIPQKESSSLEQNPNKVTKIIQNNVPHRILFAQNIPDAIDNDMLSTLFKPYPGFQEVRTVPGKKGLAFIEFQDQIQATIALQNLNGFQLTETEILQLTYGKQ